jgi:hypothetical protein
VASLPTRDRISVSLRKQLKRLGIGKERLLHSNGPLELAGYILIKPQSLQPHPFSPRAPSVKSLSCVERWRVAKSRGFFTLLEGLWRRRRPRRCLALHPATPRTSSR